MCREVRGGAGVLSPLSALTGSQHKDKSKNQRTVAFLNIVTIIRNKTQTFNRDFLWEEDGVNFDFLL